MDVSGVSFLLVDIDQAFHNGIRWTSDGAEIRKLKYSSGKHEDIEVTFMWKARTLNLRSH